VRDSVSSGPARQAAMGRARSLTFDLGSSPAHPHIIINDSRPGAYRWRIAAAADSECRCSSSDRRIPTSRKSHIAVQFVIHFVLSIGTPKL